MHSIAQQMAALRQQAGHSQRSMAKAMGVSLRTINELENGGGNPTLHTLENVARFFRLELVVQFKGNRAKR